MARSSWVCWIQPTAASRKPSRVAPARGIGGRTGPINDDRPSYAPVDIPPPNPFPGYDDGGLIHRKCHPCARSKVSPMCRIVQTSRKEVAWLLCLFESMPQREPLAVRHGRV